ncbi:AraC family transcriptional regulator [Kiritimatiellaeota bacterium B1221]|nr:AraC family transcriptional regulator [Kiritimatiellaeota bacterium B1221]
MRYQDCTQLRCSLYACYQGNPGTLGREMNVQYTSAWLLYAGKAELTTNGHTVSASAGQWLIGGQGPRIQRLSKDLRMLSVLFLANWPSGDALITQGLPVVFDQQTCPALEKTGLQINRTIGRHLPEHNYLKLLKSNLPIEAYLSIQEHLPAFLRELIAVLREHRVVISGERSLDPRIADVLKILSETPLDRRPVFSDFAQHTGLSPAHLDRLFLAQIGQTMKQFFDQRKLHYAENALRIPDTRVKEVASDLGYASLANFTRWFRRFHPMSPRNFQQEAFSIR